MNKNLIALLIIVLGLSLVPLEGHAQLSKQERKEWKKKKKSMSEEAFKQMVDENKSLKAQVSSLNNQLSALEPQLNEKDNTIATLEKQLRQAQAEVTAAQRALEESAAGGGNQQQASGYSMDESGVVFKVQVGAFKNKDLSKYFENHPNFGGETEDGLQKITLGQFRDYWEADTFKKYLREMGVKDAWIVAYKDGNRVPLKDVLEGVI
ncbi:Ezrin/radixin/moesin family protein [Marinigracilibium pacificum]|uniref:Ezrin/radixin/moesin family protein n=1 Tax=Marinigracilibium pacificum TaxID=2729599 RepID=A0A848IRK4_9BACT|nr:Ezrin/radixin/moesin family protein [Marinigracilibium pacificum]NMM47103.1 Ezrin/radixin/moesin family protein [Marinigracilibium pacificum]